MHAGTENRETLPRLGEIETQRAQMFFERAIDRAIRVRQATQQIAELLVAAPQIVDQVLPVAIRVGIATHPHAGRERTLPGEYLAALRCAAGAHPEAIGASHSGREISREHTLVLKQ